MDIVIQVIGFLGMAANFASFQFKKHKHILLFRTINEALFIAQYFLLGALSGAFLNLVGCLRNILFTRQVAKGKSTIVTTIIFSVLFTAFGILTFDGFKSIMLILAKVLSTVAYGNKNTTVIRTVSFVTHVSYLFYNIAVFSLAGAISDGILLISLAVAIIRFDLCPYFAKKRSPREITSHKV